MGKTGRPNQRATKKWALAGLLLFISASLTGQEEGDVAERNFLTPESLVVVDVETTIKERSLEGEAVPLVIRRNDEALQSAIAQLSEAFARTRERFLDALEETFGTREIGIREINSSRFRIFRNEFQSGNPLMPVNLVLAQTWAKGYDGGPTLDRLAGALRSTMDTHLIGDLRQSSTTFLVSLSESDRIRNWGEAAKFATVLEDKAVLTPEEAGLELRRSLDALDRIMGGFVTGMLQSNVTEDPYLTSLVLADRLGGRAVQKRFNPGQMIARKGDRIDLWAALALEKMRRSGIEPLSVVRPKPAPKPEPPPQVEEGPVEGPSVVAEEVWFRNLPLLVGAGVCVVIGGAALAVLFFRRRRHGGSIVSAGEKHQDLKEAVAPHLARELKDKLVGALYSQRGALLDNEQAASGRVAELEARLARLQPAIAEKIRSYEQRIAALEDQLEEKDQETRDLISAKLVLARKELNEEIARNRIEWNN